jgi:hypothetical protein
MGRGERLDVPHLAPGADADIGQHPAVVDTDKHRHAAVLLPGSDHPGSSSLGRRRAAVLDWRASLLTDYA